MTAYYYSRLASRWTNATETARVRVIAPDCKQSAPNGRVLAPQGSRVQQPASAGQSLVRRA